MEAQSTNTISCGDRRRREKDDGEVLLLAVDSGAEAFAHEAEA